MNMKRRIVRTALAGFVSGLLVLGIGGRALMRLLAFATPEDPRFTWYGTLQIIVLGALWGLLTGPLILAAPSRLRESQLGAVVFSLVIFALAAIPFLLYSGFIGSLVAPTSFLWLGALSFPALFVAWGAVFFVLRRCWYPAA